MQEMSLQSELHIRTSFWATFLSALNPGDQVVQQEEDQDQAHRDVAENAAVVSPGSDHGRETLHAAAQQTRRTQEV